MYKIIILNKQLYLMLVVFFYLILNLYYNLLLYSQIISTFVIILNLYFAFNCNLIIAYSFTIAYTCIALTRALNKRLFVTSNNCIIMLTTIK